MERYRSPVERRTKRDAKEKEKIYNGVVVNVQKKGVRTYDVKLVGLSNKLILYGVKSSVVQDLFIDDGCIINFMGRGKTQPYIIAIAYMGADSQDSGARAETGVFDSSDFDSCVFE